MPYKDPEKQREWNRQHPRTGWRKNRDDRTARNRELLKSLKDNQPCTDCGVRYPHYVMDFDHRNGAEKKINVAAAVTWSTAFLLAEIAKCELVCANCHRERTWPKRVR